MTGSMRGGWRCARRPGPRRHPVRVDLPAIVDDHHQVAGHQGRIADAHLAHLHACRERAACLVEPVNITLEVPGHDAVVHDPGRRESAVQQRLLPPHFRAGARLECHHLAIGVRHVEHVVIEHQAAIARGLVRPPDLPGVERQHRHASLEADRVDVVARDADRRIDVHEALELGTAVRRRHLRLPRHRAVAAVHREQLAVVEPAQHHLADDHRSGRAAQRQPRHCLLLRPQLVAVIGAERMQLAVDRAHRDEVRGDRGSGQHFTVQPHLPARLAAHCVKGEQLPVARADEHQLLARRGTTR
jgi:hypothetical protein